MKTKLYPFLLIVLIAVCLIACNNKSEVKKEKTTAIVTEQINPIDTFTYHDYNSVAKILAGENPNDTMFLKEIINSDNFNYYKKTFENTWQKHVNELNKIDTWSKQYLSNEDTVFYPFGGPDFNYLDAFFPDCRFAVMIGLEKGGKIPFSDSLSVANYNQILNMVNQTIGTNIAFSFFRTNSMAVHLAEYLEGTLPIVMMFMSKHDYDIININPIYINDNGNFEYTNQDVVYAYTMTKDFQDAYEIIYKKSDDNYFRKLYYLSMDVSDSVINEQSFSLMMQNYFNQQTTFLKAASYLLDRPQFNIIKAMILKNSQQIITGPSGVQYRDFDESWDIELFGNYISPIRLFYDRQQNDLKEAYKNGHAQPIEFLFDYHTGSPSLLIATKKQ